MPAPLLLRQARFRQALAGDSALSMLPLAADLRIVPDGNDDNLGPETP